MSRTRLTAVAAAVVAVSALGAACGGGGDASHATAAVHAKAAKGTSTADSGQATPHFQSYTATAIQPKVDVHSSPSGPTTQTLNNPTSDGVPLTFLLTPNSNQTGGTDWVNVFLPVRPNGSTGWIPASSVKLAGNQYLLVVNLSKHQLTSYNNGSLEHTFPIAEGAPDTPTPVGTFYITNLLKPQNPAVYGDYAYGLSGHSPTLTDFEGYDAQLGLHGTGDPSSVGHSVSHGCIRLYNPDIDQLASNLPLGTPVVVVA